MHLQHAIELLVAHVSESGAMTGSQSPPGSLLLNQKKMGLPGLHLARHSSLSSSPSSTVWDCGWWVISGRAEREGEMLVKQSGGGYV